MARSFTCNALRLIGTLRYPGCWARCGRSGTRLASHLKRFPREARDRRKQLFSARPKCVLVVDDDDEIRQVVGEILKFGGYRVELAADGEQALARLNATRPDAIILDLMMPVMDGWTFLKNCSAARPVVVLTGYSAHGPAATTLQVRDVLTKPFEMDVLLETI